MSSGSFLRLSQWLPYKVPSLTTLVAKVIFPKLGCDCVTHSQLVSKVYTKSSGIGSLAPLQSDVCPNSIFPYSDPTISYKLLTVPQCIILAPGCFLCLHQALYPFLLQPYTLLSIPTHSPKPFNCRFLKEVISNHHPGRIHCLNTAPHTGLPSNFYQDSYDIYCPYL